MRSILLSQVCPVVLFKTGCTNNEPPDEVLSQDEHHTLRLIAFNRQYNVSDRANFGMRKLLSPWVNVQSKWKQQSLLRSVSNLEYVLVECCVDSCMAFTGEYEDAHKCIWCSEPQYDEKGRPHNIFRYIPLIPRLSTFFFDPHLVELLNYRHKYEHQQGVYHDIFDGSHYHKLCETYVSIGDQILGYKFFEQMTDIALGLTFDGVSLFKDLGARVSKNQYSCTPLAVIVFNLPPTIHMQLENILCLGVIPGPHEPKLLNTFLHPLYMECIAGAQGVKVFNAATLCTFELHFFIIVVIADIKALIKSLGTKGPNGISPCHKCPIRGMHNSTNPSVTTHYIPFTPPGGECQYDYLLANPRTTATFHEQYKKIHNAPTKQAKDALRKEFGINYESLIAKAPGMDLVASHPVGPMHEIAENLMPNLFKLWSGRFKGLDEGSGDYRISVDDWNMIGQELEASWMTIPSAFVRKMPNIFLSPSKMQAEDWMFWGLWLSPYLLAGRLPEPYYSHHLLLVKALKMYTHFTMTTSELNDFADSMHKWIIGLEEYVLVLKSFIL